MNSWFKAFVIFIALLGVMSPLVFAWIVEISWQPVQSGYLTNGFWNIDVMKGYHIALWYNIFSSIASSFVLLYLVINSKGVQE